MNLVLEKWTKQDGKEFMKYLQSFAKPDRVDWTRRIINTNMPLLAVPTPELKKIAKEILKGNFVSFLELELTQYYENIAINGFVISGIKDFELYKNFLINFANLVDNWANCDLLNFGVNKNNEKEFFDLSLKLFADSKPFVRRIGANIWFKFINTEYLNKIFNVINSPNEEEYYVNMCIAWFVAECFIKRRETTLKFLKTNKLNKFTINKAISKCRDSYRVSAEDKQMLLAFKK